ncbi:hypothetical protein OQJ26_13910 [Legionella sp. PATHC038]|uniref:hypothetical protein n=1 Tax=Legionella sheltonii TaxID=2992041 RepID=UPI0022444182|nr:hypothetical protein [Legionella sp. PATHC038]MCW8399884.1 hypothetical protein [Legionella sp. PATHC038]
MKIETYKEKFVELTEHAMKLSSFCKSKNELQKEITALSNEAVVFYKTNSDHKEDDYQLRIEIFLEFDNFLKCLKRDFEPQSQVSKNNSFFKKLKQIKKSDSYETIPNIENSKSL